jgi:hypothetical protein
VTVPVGKSAAWAVQAAAYAALNVAAYTALGGEVYDHVPQTATYPYTRITVPSEIRFDCMGKAGKELLLQVHVFSDYRGQYEAAAAINKAVELLHYTALTVTGYTHVSTQLDQIVPAFEEDVGGVTIQHQVATLRVWVEQT